MTSAELRRFATSGGIATTLAFALVLTSGAWSAGAAECGPASIFDGTCDVSGGIHGDEVVVEGSGGTPGAGSSQPGGDAASGPVDPNADCLYLLNGRCLAAGPGRAAPVQPITFADIAAFRPDPGIDRMEPNGWMVVGLDTNFYGSAGSQVVGGTLLGEAASVRFTPVAWHWTYGDGAAASRSTPGATWASQRLAEFDPTPTSHVYRAPGTYVIDLTIDFAAEYRVGGMPWTDIAGVLPLAANRLVAVAGDAKTVLVERECTVNPSGPGC